MNRLRRWILPGLLVLSLMVPVVAQNAQGSYGQQQAIRVTQGPTIQYADDQFAVISWTTNVPSETRVYYGQEPGNLTQVAEGPANTTTHSVHLSNLHPLTKYYFQIEDGQGNGPGQITHGFETVAKGANPIRNQRPTEVARAQPQGAAIVSGPEIQYADDRSAVITWTTDKPAPNVLYYGMNEGSLNQSAEGEGAASTFHRLHLANLTPATGYFFQIETGQPPNARMQTYKFHTVPSGNAPIYSERAALASGPLANQYEQGTAPQSASSSGSPQLSPRPKEQIYKGGLLIPAGSEVHATLDTPLSSKTSRAGDEFTATVNQPVISQNGVVAVPQGARIRGNVTDVEQGKVLASVRGKARLDLRFTDVVLPNGTTLPITATLLGVGQKAGSGTNEEGQVTDKTQGREVAKDVGIGAGLGTVAGLLFGSALKGLAIGAIAGGGYVLATQGRDVQIPEGSQLNIRLDHQLSVPPQARPYNNSAPQPMRP